jgi:hypothetical protein
MSGQLFYGSINLTDLIELAKKKHSAFTKGNNGKIYAAINIWLNDEKDKFGNIMSVQINPSKEMKDLEDRVYIGNLKQSEGPKPVSDRDVNGLDTDFDVPQRQTNSGAVTNPNPAADVTEPFSDLPF